MSKTTLTTDSNQLRSPGNRAHRLAATVLALALLLGACQSPGAAEPGSSPVQSAQGGTTGEKSPGADSAVAQGYPTPDLEKSYHSDAHGFVLFYPQEGEITQQDQDSARIELPFQAGTNLVEKYLEVSVQEGRIPCSSPLAEGRDPASVQVESVTFDGQTFIKESGSGVATGNIYDWVAYSTVNGELCVSLSYVLHSTNPGNYETPPPPFDLEGETIVFEAVTDSFAWER